MKKKVQNLIKATEIYLLAVLALLIITSIITALLRLFIQNPEYLLITLVAVGSGVIIRKIYLMLDEHNDSN